jgi:sugar transferase (PEP-CTERM system associated)
MIRIFRVSIPTSTVALIVSEIVLIFSCFLVASYLVLDVDPEVFLFYDEGLSRIFIVVLSVMLGLYFQDLYIELRVRSRILLLQQVCLAVGIMFLLQALITYLNPSLMLSRWLLVLGSGLILILVPILRTLYSRIILSAFGAQRVLFLGASEAVQDIVRQLREKPHMGIVPVGYLDEDCTAGDERAGVRVLGKLTDLADAVAKHQPDRIVVGITERRNVLPMNDLLDLRFAGVQIEEAASLYESVTGRVSIKELRPSQLIFTTDLGPRPRSIQIQRWYSFLISLIGIAVAAPIMFLVALAVKLSSPGQILYRQRRVGLNGEQFTVMKFRSMKADAEALTGAVWAAKDDPRVTGVGKILRATRLDELPQLFNVLKGEMSIVGPRPERPEFVHTLSEQIQFYRQRHSVKPGITGWAQINYKYGETLEDAKIKLEYDLYYIKNLSPALDAVIMLHTLKVMLFSSHGQ